MNEVPSTIHPDLKELPKLLDIGTCMEVLNRDTGVVHQVCQAPDLAALFTEIADTMAQINQKEGNANG
jgi:hypothetical protein